MKALKAEFWGTALFGTYDNFPKAYHSIARFSYTTPRETLQKAVFESLHRLNKVDSASSFLDFTRHNIEVRLEFGIADGLSFTYMDNEILGNCVESLSNTTFSALDFLCIIRYHLVEKERRTSLKFDYHLLRFLFEENQIELQVYHDKGPRRLSIRDLITLLAANINQELAKRKAGILTESFIHAL